MFDDSSVSVLPLREQLGSIRLKPTDGWKNWTRTQKI
jgi:hypothetical protein